MFFNEGRWPVSEMCAALKVTRQGYYAWKRRPPSAHAMRDEELAELISQVRAEVRGIYGAPKAFFALRRMGVRTSMKRAAERESAEDLVKREFSADGPNMARFADTAYVKTRQGWLYLALVTGVWSRRIVGWAMGPSITAELADEAPRMALARRNNPKGCVHHSDRGSRYVPLPPSETMRERGIRPSTGPVSSPRGNAAMESPTGVAKSECVHARVCAARDEAALDIFECIEAVCSRARTRSALGYMSPAGFEEANWPDDEGRPRAA